MASRPARSITAVNPVSPVLSRDLSYSFRIRHPSDISFEKMTRSLSSYRSEAAAGRFPFFMSSGIPLTCTDAHRLTPCHFGLSQTRVIFSQCPANGVGRVLGHQVPARQLVPTSMPVAVDPLCDCCDEGGGNSGIDVDSVAVAARVLVDRFDVQGVVPGLEDAAMLVGAQRLGGFVLLEDLNCVPIGGDQMKRHQPAGVALANL